MLSHNFIPEVLSEIDRLVNVFKIHDPEVPKYLQEDAENRIDDLKSFLNSFNKLTGLNPQDIKRLEDHLADHWWRIREDARSYLAQPYSPVTKAHLFLAARLAEHHHGFIYTYLMPTIAAGNNDISEWDKYGLQEFIIGRHSRVLFVSECLFALGTTANSNKRISIRGHVLDEEEIKKLEQHSTAAWIYLCKLRDNSSEEQRRLLKKEFEEHIHSDAYTVNCPKILMYNSLKKMILKITPHDFLSNMQSLSPQEWQDFLSEVCNLKDLQRIILNNIPLNAFLDSVNFSKEQNITALIFCIAEIYKLERGGQGNYIYRLSSFTKDDKLLAVNHFKDAIVEYSKAQYSSSQENLDYYLDIHCTQADKEALNEEHYLSGKSVLCKIKNLACVALPAGPNALSELSKPESIKPGVKTGLK